MSITSVSFLRPNNDASDNNRTPLLLNRVGHGVALHNLSDSSESAKEVFLFGGGIVDEVGHAALILPSTDVLRAVIDETGVRVGRVSYKQKQALIRNQVLPCNPFGPNHHKVFQRDGLIYCLELLSSQFSVFDPTALKFARPVVNLQQHSFGTHSFSQFYVEPHTERLKIYSMQTTRRSMKDMLSYSVSFDVESQEVHQMAIRASRIESTLPSVVTVKHHASSVYLPRKREIVFYGGQNEDNNFCHDNILSLNLWDNTVAELWRQPEEHEAIIQYPLERYGCAVCVSDDERLLFVYGGTDVSQETKIEEARPLPVLHDLWSFDFCTRKWVNFDLSLHIPRSLAPPRTRGSMILLAPRQGQSARLLLTGGFQSNEIRTGSLPGDGRFDVSDRFFVMIGVESQETARQKVNMLRTARLHNSQQTEDSVSQEHVAISVLEPDTTIFCS